MVAIALLLMLGGEPRAFSWSGEAAKKTYQQAVADHHKTGKDLFVYVGGIKPRSHPGATVLEVDSLPGYPPRCIVVHEGTTREAPRSSALPQFVPQYSPQPVYQEPRRGVFRRLC